MVIPHHELPDAPVPALSRSMATLVTRIYLVLAVGLIPWIGYIACSLPHRSISRHYDLAWSGFDVLLLVALGRTAWLAWRRSPAVAITAAVSGALLVVDAWFDVVTSSPGSQRLEAILLAGFVEIPLAIMSVSIARSAITRVTAAAGG